MPNTNFPSEMILEVSGLSELMENTPMNRDSVKLRERIVLPLITDPTICACSTCGRWRSRKNNMKNFTGSWCSVVCLELSMRHATPHDVV